MRLRRCTTALKAFRAAVRTDNRRQGLLTAPADCYERSMCHCRPEVRTPCCGPDCCGLPGGCAFCKPALDPDTLSSSLGIRPEDVKEAVKLARVKKIAASKLITGPELNKVRHALYDAKLALESGFDGPDKDTVIRTIVEALDVTAHLEDPIT